jgi:mRNA interferase MazF
MTAPTAYTPERGDLVWLEFTPQAGHEQAGRRPALVLSRSSFHTRTGFAYLVPITSRPKGFPDELPLPAGLLVQGVLLCDQAKSLDWQARNVRFIEAAPVSLVNAALIKVLGLIA